MKTTDSEFLKAMVVYANRLKDDQEDLLKAIPELAESSAELTLTGVVFRPATEEDFEDDEDEDAPDPGEGDWFVFEAHLFALDHVEIGSVMAKVLFSFEDCPTFDDAVLRFYQGVTNSLSSHLPNAEA